jgi:hypothetical protein
MANQLIAHLRHVVYYLSKLKEIQKMFGENNSIAIGVVNWGYEKENINLGQKIALEQKSHITDNENIWFDYTVAGFSFLNAIDPFQLLTWIVSSLYLARQMGDFEKQLALLDYLALTYKSTTP